MLFARLFAEFMFTKDAAYSWIQTNPPGRKGKLKKRLFSALSFLAFHYFSIFFLFIVDLWTGQGKLATVGNWIWLASRRDELGARGFGAAGVLWQGRFS